MAICKPLNQSIHEKYQLGPVYHMTHLQNIKSIFEVGEILSYNLMRDKSYFNLANLDVQSGRSQVVIKESRKPLHDYVPLYFGFKTPMVAVNQIHNDQLLFLRFSLDFLQDIKNVIISDGNARATETKFKILSRIDDLSILDVKAIRGLKYAQDKELKRKKQAELLIPDKLPLKYLLNIICFSENSKTQLLDLLTSFAIDKNKISVNPGWYFTEKKDH